MRKIYMMVFPLLLAVFLVCGCANNRDADAMCYFDCDKVITLKIGTANSNDMIGYAPLMTNTTMQNILIEYDEDIISYQPATGKIIALKAGETRIKSTVNGKSKSIQVKVSEAIYCSSLICYDFVMEYGKSANILTSNRNYVKTNSNYNMGYSFESLTPDILSINQEGEITANSVGVGLVKIVAKTGINANVASGYDVVVRNVEVRVVERRDNLTLDILDSDMKSVPYTMKEGIKNYILYSTENEPINYILKISSDQPLTNCMIAEATTYNDCVNLVQNSNNTRLWVANQKYAIQDNIDTVAYQKFYVVDCGTDFIQKTILDTGANFYNNNLSEPVSICVYKLTTSKDISMKVYGLDKVSEYDLKNSDNQYCLYTADEERNTSASIVYVSPQINTLCNPNFNYRAENITVTQDESGMLAISCGDTGGVGRLIIQANDGSEVIQIIEFYTYKAAITITTTAKAENIMYLNKGSGTFYAKYCVHDEGGNEISAGILDLLFFDNEYNLITGAVDGVRYYDTLYPSFAIEFTKEGKYIVMLKTSESQYYSDFITIYVYDENSLTK